MVYAQHIDCYGQNDEAREDKTNADCDTSPAKQKKLKRCYFGTLKLNPIQMGEGFWGPPISKNLNLSYDHQT